MLARRGDALTVRDVVDEAGVSNGTFYNYFVDREDLVDALAERLVEAMAADAAADAIDDPALRFAVATAQPLRRTLEDPTWGRVVLRLIHRPALTVDLDRFLRADLDDGRARGRFVVGADDVVVDQVLGLLVMSIRRLVEDPSDVDRPLRVVARALVALGVESEEALRLARRAWEGTSLAEAS